MQNNIRRKNNVLYKGIVINIILAVLLIVIFFIGCNSGQYSVSIEEVFSVLIGEGTQDSNLVLFEYRLPRLCLAVLVGVGMGMSGVVMQDLLHNNLASPGTLGVSAGSGLLVTIYVAFVKAQSSSAILLPILALGGGLISAGLIFLLGTNKKKQVNPTRLIMTGVAMSSVYGAIGTFMMLILDKNQLEFLQRWQSGELWGTQWRFIVVFTIWLLIFSGITYWKSRTLNVINLGYDIATGLGVNMSKQFIFLSLCAVALSSASVAFGGNFFFLGLIGPHIARRLVGSDARLLLPSSGIIAAIIVQVSDILVRSWSVLANIPTGIIVSVLAVPYFLYLLVRS